MKIKRPILVALLAGFLSLLLAFAFLKSKEIYFHSMEEGVFVLAAKKNIAEGSLVSAMEVEKIEIPRRFLQPAALSNAEEAEGKIAVAPVLKGEQIVATKLIPLGIKSGLALRIPLGLRALSVEVDEVSGVAGLIRPNNFVDILATFDQTRTLAQRVLVLAVDQEFSWGIKRESNDSKTKKEFMADEKKKTITLALTPEQVQEVEFAKVRGKISFALRPQGEEDLRELK